MTTDVAAAATASTAAASTNAPTATPWPGLNAPLEIADPEVAEYIGREVRRQQETLEMIASENFAPVAAMQAQGSVLTNKYAEGYPGRRYYGGCENVDVIETLAIERVKALFGAEVRERPAAFRRAGQRRRHAGADQAGRHHPRPVSRARWAPDPRHADQLLRAAATTSPRTRCPRRTTGSTWTRCPGWPGSTRRS